MTSPSDRERRLQEEADAAEVRRVNREGAEPPEFMALPPETLGPPKTVGESPTVFAVQDPEPCDWRRERQERIDRDHERYEESRR